MKIHYLQHVPYEDLGSMEPHLKARGHELSCSPLYKSELSHAVEDLDWLIITGGPMGVRDERIYPWLVEEKRFIREVIAQGKPVLGICLGAQLAAEALGAEVRPNPLREIGWFPVQRVADPASSPLAAVFPDTITAFHWHGDTFDLPEGAIHLASSEACRNQGFIWNNQVIGLQFHLETTQSCVENLIAHCGDELDGSVRVQTPSAMLMNPGRFPSINRVMSAVLDVMEEQIR
ncbi:MAG TPA: type 1 glutamine amidotransferase [Pseudomonadaceae bacterium]|nr:type 1 glutamine amidotransferase [Pseudomonadaceae bacterium]